MAHHSQLDYPQGGVAYAAWQASLGQPDDSLCDVRINVPVQHQEV
jgi:hypothetical protein